MGSIPRCLFAFVYIVPLALLSSSCGSGGTEPPPPPPSATKLALVAAPSATAETMIPLAAQPIFQTTDASGHAMPARATITAEVVSGTGAVMAGGSVTTDANGRGAFSELTLGGVWGQV